jgi:hypothetical protein
MANWQLTTPVVLIIYKRPETTARVLAEIAKAKPPKLLVIADGPRPGIPGEEEKITATRAVIDRVDWDCEVLKNYAETNLGLRIRPSSGLSWVFENVGEAIILEDDCLPHPTFFRFCEELLEKYRHDKRIMMISGDNFQFGKRRNSFSYYFSRFSHIWGWASWRRAWQYYDYNMHLWPEIRENNLLQNIIIGTNALDYWNNIFQSVYDKKIDTWDFQWLFACWIQSGLCIIPNGNLVSNLGFGPSATHTKTGDHLACLPSVQMNFPLRHPTFILQNVEADTYTFEKIYFMPLRKRILQLIKKRVKGALKILGKNSEAINIKN